MAAWRDDRASGVPRGFGRGVIVALAVSVPFWLLIGYGVWLLTR